MMRDDRTIILALTQSLPGSLTPDGSETSRLPVPNGILFSVGLDQKEVHYIGNRVPLGTSSLPGTLN